MEDNKEIKEFQAFLVNEAKSKNKDPETYVKELGEDGMKQAYKRYQEAKKKQAQKAAHGAKLQFINSLKHKCAEDEELYYFKKGGSVGCGCKKKENGGEVTKAKEGEKVVDKFKKAKKFQNPSGPITNNNGSVKIINGVKYIYTGNGNWKPETKKDRETQQKNRDDARKGKGEGTHIEGPANSASKIKVTSSTTKKDQKK